MIKIYFQCSWTEDKNFVLDWLKRSTPNGSGVWENLEGTTNLEEADYIVHLGNLKNHTTPSKVIQFRREPDFIMPFKALDEAKYVSDYGNVDNYHFTSWWNIAENYTTLSELDYDANSKPEKCSTICSPKHKHRNEFLFEVSNHTPYQIDMYGPPPMQGVFGKLYRPIHRVLKTPALLPYDYSIAMENSSQSNYWTEKISDCYLCWTMPIYWGCPNIHEFFPEDSYKLLDIKDPKSIKEIMEQPIEDKHIQAMREARDLVLNKYNIWPTLKRII